MDVFSGEVGSQLPIELPALLPDSTIDPEVAPADAEALLGAPVPDSPFEMLRPYGPDAGEDLEGTIHVAHIVDGAVSFLDDQGSWAQIDPTLVEASGGYRNQAGPIDLLFPNSLTPSTPVTVDLVQGTITHAPIGADPTVEPEVEENRISYANLLPETDFLYGMGFDGYAEQILLNTPEASSSLAFDVTVAGLTLREEIDGEISILQGEEVVGSILEPWVGDSTTLEGDDPTPDPAADAEGDVAAALEDVDLGGLGGSGSPVPVTQTLTDLGGGDYRIDVRVEQAWYADRRACFR